MCYLLIIQILLFNDKFTTLLPLTDECIKLKNFRGFLFCNFFSNECVCTYFSLLKMFLLTTINCPPYKQILNYKRQELGLSLTNGIVALIIIVALLASLY